MRTQVLLIANREPFKRVEAADSCWCMCMDYHFWLVIVARTEVLLLANRILEVNSCLVIICTLFVSFQDVKTLVWYKYEIVSLLALTDLSFHCSIL